MTAQGGSPSPLGRARRGDALARLFLVAAVALVACVAAAFLAVAQPSSDDWCRGATGSALYEAGIERSDSMVPSQGNGLAYVADQYVRWTGRWAGIGLAVASMSLLDPTRHYWVLLSLLAVCHVLAVRALSKAVLGASPPRRADWFAALGFAVLLWAGMPSPGQAVYWLTGGIENMLGVSLTLLLLARLIAAGDPARPRPRGIRRACLFTGAALLAFVATGVHELFGLLACIVLAAGTWTAFRLASGSRWLWLCALFAALVGLAFVAAAPGNYVRASEMQGSADVGRTVREGTRHLLKSLCAWTLDPKLICASLLFALHPAVRSLRPAWSARPSAAWARVLPAAWFAVVAIPFFAVVWLKGRPPDDRTLSGTYYVFLLGWFANLFVFTRSARPVPPLDDDPLLRRVVSRALPVALGAALVVTGNARTAIQDIEAGRPTAWRRAIRARDREIRAAAGRGIDELAVEAPPECPHILFDNERIDAPDTALRWHNEGLAAFYGMRLIWQEPARR